MAATIAPRTASSQLCVVAPTAIAKKAAVSIIPSRAMLRMFACCVKSAPIPASRMGVEYSTRTPSKPGWMMSVIALTTLLAWRR